MAAIVASLIVSLFLSGFTWLAFGNRFAFDEDARQNDILNLGAYVGLFFLVGLAVSFAIARL
ncbi:MAG: hypothetical protein VX766_06925 [Pseudomonadota bacterium]|nr:hypothetical protein [Pseudomonadota bacterium]